ncbi:MAG: tRNA pseudouridine55 synthase [Actinomycetota bacterium]|jgi:tRNA pseudouridine55 synthase|nr:tRNA pseudouridine55 synthase [Actinomycetota bacterium]
MRDGLVVVDKAAGWTSHDVVAKLRGVYGQKRIGHAGTLDPDATGVLLVGLGRVTRLLRYLQEAGKEYRGRVVFGVATDTLDGAGAVLERTEMSFTRAELDAAARAFVGDIEQVPPMVSALKVGGRRLYELARAGEEVERVARPVHISELVVEDLEPGAYAEATIRVACSSGTYIRTLAADLGAALGGCAHLGTLRRMRIGSFTLDEARPIEAIEADPEAAVLAPAVAMRDLERVVVDGERARAVAHGATFAAPALVGESEGTGPFAVVDENDALLAVYERRGGGVKPSVVVATEAAIS